MDQYVVETKSLCKYVMDLWHVAVAIECSTKINGVGSPDIFVE